MQAPEKYHRPSEHQRRRPTYKRHGNKQPSSHHYTEGIKEYGWKTTTSLPPAAGFSQQKTFPTCPPLPGCREEALCFGFRLNSTRKKTASGFLAQRLTPRSRKSKWSELNKERVRRLARLGLMTPHGEKCLPEMNPETFRIDSYIFTAPSTGSAYLRQFPMAFPRPIPPCAPGYHSIKKTSRNCSASAWKNF